MIASTPRISAPDGTFTVALPVHVRACTADDLPALEWFGTFTHHRELIQRAFARQRKGEVLMLLAVSGVAPVGQVWIDRTRPGPRRTGWIWALRVFPWLCGRGIGSRLLDAAEGALSGTGCTRAELSVAFANARARRLYERRGYKAVRKIWGEHACTTPWGAFDHYVSEELMMRKTLPPSPPAGHGEGDSVFAFA
jgi:ribosomal protein S18 acetylase RimI-like enzyme